LISSITILILVIIGAIIPGKFGSVANTLFTFTHDNSGWLYLLIVFAIIIFLVGLAISKYGVIRLDSNDSRPRYHVFTCIGMFCMYWDWDVIFSWVWCKSCFLWCSRANESFL